MGEKLVIGFDGISDTVTKLIEEADAGISIVDRSEPEPHIAIVYDDLRNWTVERAAKRRREGGVILVVVLTNTTDDNRRWVLQTKGAGMLHRVPKSVEEAAALLKKIRQHVN